jgi:hypothetical protein
VLVFYLRKSTQVAPEVWCFQGLSTSSCVIFRWMMFELWFALRSLYMQ